MNRLVAGFIFSMVIAASGNSSSEAVWSTAVATRSTDGHRIIHRYRSEFASSFQRSKFPERVIITWRYKSSDGMPSKAEHESMNQLEDLLAPPLEQPDVSTLVIVSTGEGLREWVYYARSQEEFMSKLNEALRAVPRFPIEIDLWRDAKWQRYDEFRSHIRE